MAESKGVPGLRVSRMEEVNHATHGIDCPWAPLHRFENQGWGGEGDRLSEFGRKSKSQHNISRLPFSGFSLGLR